MYVLGLTGSIAMGKSWATQCFRHLAIPVHEADVCVHGLLAPGGAAVSDVLAAFLGVEDDNGGVDRQKLGASVFGHSGELALLEYILHPLVHQSQLRFLAQQARTRCCLAVLDIPLLFETGAQIRVDGVMVMTAPVDLQYARALQRPGMTLEKLHAIMDQQMPDALKRLGADFVVSTAGTKGRTLGQIQKIVKTLKSKRGKVWGPSWVQPKLKRRMSNA